MEAKYLRGWLCGGECLGGLEAEPWWKSGRGNNNHGGAEATEWWWGVNLDKMVTPTVTMKPVCGEIRRPLQGAE